MKVRFIIFPVLDWVTTYVCGLQDLEERSGAELESVSEQVRVCEGVLEGERRQRLAVQEDMTRLTQEMQLLREDLDKERISHRENVQVRI